MKYAEEASAISAAGVAIAVVPSPKSIASITVIAKVLLCYSCKTVFDPDPINDTSEEAEKVMLAIYRKMPISRKFELVAEAQQASKAFALAGLRARHPEDSTALLERKYFDLTLGPELAAKVYGPLNSEEPLTAGAHHPSSDPLPRSGTADNSGFADRVGR